MKRILPTVLALAGCSPADPVDSYGFVGLIGRDTISVESVTRRGDLLTIDAVDRFPRVRHRRAEIRLSPDGGIRRLEMEIRTPSEPLPQRIRRVVAEVEGDSVRITRTDSAGTLRSAFHAGGAMVIPHVPQMYSLYELYFAAARGRSAAGGMSGDTVRMRQFYVDREFDRFPLHRAVVRVLGPDRAEITHDWLAGTGEAAFDSTGRMVSYTGARTTYDVRVTRLGATPDVRGAGQRFEAHEREVGATRALSARDTVRATIGRAAFTVDYSRPLARGRVLLGGLVPYDRVWRTGANAATGLTLSAPVTIGGLRVPAGSYTLWTIPRRDGAELIVNRQTGQWGTAYGRAHDLGRIPLATETVADSVERFTISIDATGEQRGKLVLSWGSFRWSAMVEAP